MSVADERRYRDEQWESLTKAPRATAVPPGRLHQLRIYRPARGIWVDSERTTPAVGGAATVGLLHTGRHYADDLSEDGVLYHYPRTRRPGRDAMEVSATKRAAELALPVFLITRHPHRGQRRDVYRGFIHGWDDRAELFLIMFDSVAPTSLVDQHATTDGTFTLFGAPGASKRMVKARPNQQRFKFLVLDRYGPTCAVCSVSVPGLLDAAHLAEKRDLGSDDPRNGLPLCPLHHRAFDLGLFAVDPTSLAIAVRPSRATAEALRLERTSIAHLAQLPRKEALDWRWNIWQEQATGDTGA